MAAGLMYGLMSFFVDTNSWDNMVTVHGLWMVPADLLNTALLYACLRHYSPERAPFLTLVWILTPTGLVLGPVRFESYVISFALLGYWFHLQKRPALAALVWSLGCWFKWYPAFFLAAQEVQTLYREGLDESGRFTFTRWLRFDAHRQWIRSTLVFILVALAVNGPLIALSLQRYENFNNWKAPYYFHANRPLYWDTVLGVCTLYWGEIPWERKAATFSAGLMLIMMLVRPRLPVESKGALICMAAVLFNRVYSTQFNLWFDPFLLVLTARLTSARWYQAMLGMYVAIDLVNIFIYPFSFTRALTEMQESFQPLQAARFGRTWTMLFAGAIFLRSVMLAVWMGMVLYLDPTPPVETAVPPTKKLKKRK